MATIALRVPTVVPDQPNLRGGHCYILFTEPTVSVREVIAEKVRAELRKARAGGEYASSLSLLLPAHAEIGFGPLDEQLAIVQACRNFVDGQFLLLYNGRPLVDLDESVSLGRRTNLVFLCHMASSAETKLKDAA